MKTAKRREPQPEGVIFRIILKGFYLRQSFEALEEICISKVIQ